MKERTPGGMVAAVLHMGNALLAFKDNDGLRASLSLGILSADRYLTELTHFACRALFMEHVLGPAWPRLASRGASDEEIGDAGGSLDGWLDRRRPDNLLHEYFLAVSLLRDRSATTRLGLPLLDSSFFERNACPDLETLGCDDMSLTAALEKIGIGGERSTLPLSDLGAAHEQILGFRPLIALDPVRQLALSKEPRRKRSGSYYTPPTIVDTLVEAALSPLVERCLAAEKSPTEQEEALLALRVCDPAAGPGYVLIAAARYLAGALTQARRGSDRKALRDVICRCLYGVDRDPFALAVCKAILWQACGDRTLPLSFLDGHVRTGDSLVGVVDQSALAPPACDGGTAAGDGEAFHWPHEFPEVFGSGGFDAVVGNPPFGNAIEAATARNESETKYFRRHYPEVAAGAYDRATLYFARTVQLLKPRGTFALLAPRSIASTKGAAALRRHMDEVAPPRLIWCPGDDGLFNDARIFVVLVAGQVGVRPKEVLVSTDSAVLAEPRLRALPCPQAGAASTWWELVTAATGPCKPCQNGTVPLGEVATVWAGCTAGAAYELANCLSDGADIAGQRLITTGTLDRYKLRWGETPTRFLKRNYTAPRWPLEPANGIVARAAARQRQPKLLVAGLSKVIEAALDEEGDAGGGVSTFAVVTKRASQVARLALLAVLNSAAFSFLFWRRFGAKQMSGGNCTVGKSELSEIAVPGDLGDAFASWQEPGGEGEAGIRRARWEEVVALARALVERAEDDDWRRDDERLHWLVSLLYGISAEQHEEIFSWWKRRSAKVRRLDQGRVPGFRAAESDLGRGNRRETT